MSRVDEVIEQLVAAGFAADGHTATETHKIITAQSYPLAGQVITTGGRARFARGSLYCTVGKRTVYFYTRERGKDPEQGRAFQTSDDEGIRRFIVESVGEVATANGSVRDERRGG